MSKNLIKIAAHRRLRLLEKYLTDNHYSMALECLGFNKNLFNGMRKDGLTPEFDHHVCQANYLISFISKLIHPEETICTVMFHDSLEDKGVSKKEIENFISKEPSASLIANASWRLTKKYNGEVFNQKDLFDSMANCPIASVVKGADRINNFQTAVDVFSREKQLRYVEEGKRYFLPMLNKARNNFPSQEPVYQNIVSFLNTQMKLIVLTVSD